MKKFYTLFLLVSPLLGFAQKNLIVEAGIGNSLYGYNKKMLNDASTHPGASFYANAGFSLKIKRWTWENSLGYLSRKFRYHFFVGPDYSGNEFYQVNSVSLHSSISKTFHFIKILSLEPGAGLYGAYHVGGKMNYEYSTLAGPQKGEKELDFGDGTNDNFRRAELGGTIFTKLKFRQFFLRGSFDFSLSNGGSGSYNQTWKTFAAGIGYVFGGRL